MENFHKATSIVKGGTEKFEVKLKRVQYELKRRTGIEIGDPILCS